MKMLIGLGLLMLTLSIDGRRCKKNSQCGSGFCDGGSVWSSGTCAPLRQVGWRCLQGGDPKSCQSKRCVCDHCPDRYGKHLNNYRCSTNANCKSGWCSGYPTFGCRGTCKPRGADGVACSDNNYCSSGQCTCGSCGRKLNDGKRCSTNDNCQSGWCQGKYKIGCRGTCGSKGADGAACNDNNYCYSGQCTCGRCGRKLSNQLKCSTNDNCRSGWCQGKYTFGCRGYCKNKISDYYTCPLNDNKQCGSGRCEGVGRSFYCSPQVGFKENFYCNEDTDCDKTKSMWCAGGGAFTTGRCRTCPRNCNDGCNALFNRMDNMKCGRMTTWDHAAEAAKKIAEPLIDFLKCMGNIPDGPCATDALNSAGVCLNIKTPCVVTFGGPGSDCLKFNNEPLKYNKQFGLVRFSGTITPRIKVSVKGDLTNTKFTMGLTGSIGLDSNILIQSNWVRQQSYRGRPIGLTRPKSVYRKSLKVGYLPVLMEIKVRAVAVAKINVRSNARFKIKVSYKNDWLIQIEKANIKFDPVKGVSADIKFKDNFHKNLQSSIEVEGTTSVTSEFYIGPEFTLSVNGMPFKLFPAARFFMEGSLTKNGNCLRGGINAGFGLDMGFITQFPSFSPGAIFKTACAATVHGVSQYAPLKAGLCFGKAFAKVDLKEKAEEACFKLGDEINKLGTVSLGNPVNEFAEIVDAISKPIPLVRKAYCPGGYQSGTPKLLKSVKKRISGGGGGRGTKTCGAPGVRC